MIIIRGSGKQGKRNKKQGISKKNRFSKSEFPIYHERGSGGKQKKAIFRF
jgi:hypothetical protein